MESVNISNYNIIKELGSGAFGVVYKAEHIKSKKMMAIKIENKDVSRLSYEYNIYNGLKNKPGIPKIYSFYQMKDKNILIMDYLGPSLEDLFEFSNYKFGVKTVLMVAIQILNRIEDLHNTGYIHRDIKPENFLIGTGKKKNRIYMIDFGLSKKYQNNSQHIPYRKNCSFTGSFRYSSIRNHKGIEQSRRDDLESIGYMLIFLLKGSLPWQGLKGSTKRKRSSNIFNVKSSISLQELCKDIPSEFLLYMKYCRTLRYDQVPDYNLLRNLFIELFKSKQYTLNYIYDWNLIAIEKKKQMNNMIRSPP